MNNTLRIPCLTIVKLDVRLSVISAIWLTKAWSGSNDGHYPYYPSLDRPGIAKTDRGYPVPEPLPALGRIAEDGQAMTDLRLKTEMFEDIRFCPFCGKELFFDASTSIRTKRCVNTFHFLLIEGTETTIE